MSPTTPTEPALLLVDDEEPVLSSTRRVLRSHGYERVMTLSDSREVMPLLERERVSLLLLDLIMPHVGGETLLRDVAQRFPELPVIVVTAEQEVGTAVRCMQLGASDYLVKPVGADQLVATVRRTLEHSALEFEAARLREHFFDERVRRPEAFAEILTADPAMLRVFAYLEAISRGSHPVLIMGETGSGKELIARALHGVSERSGPFVAVNVAGLDDTMFSDTLFGHRAGAFTGAKDARRGMIESAGAGTLFLDEIGDLAEASQVKLLRLLQEREYFPLGTDSPRPLRARVIAATHRDPTELRQDLYFRLRAYHVRVPPLRERRGDVPLLVRRFVELAADDLGIAPPMVPDEALALLSRHDFPGNVRELQALVFDAVARQEGGVLSVQALTSAIGQRADAFGPTALRASTEPGADATAERVLNDEEIKRFERDNILRALERCGGKVAGTSGAAELLGLKPSTLSSRMKALGIARTDSD